MNLGLMRVYLQALDVAVTPRDGAGAQPRRSARRRRRSSGSRLLSNPAILASKGNFINWWPHNRMGCGLAYCIDSRDRGCPADKDMAFGGASSSSSCRLYSCTAASRAPFFCSRKLLMRLRTPRRASGARPALGDPRFQSVSGGGANTNAANHTSSRLRGVARAPPEARLAAFDRTARCGRDSARSFQWLWRWPTSMMRYQLGFRASRHAHHYSRVVFTADRGRAGPGRGAPRRDGAARRTPPRTPPRDSSPRRPRPGHAVRAPEGLAAATHLLTTPAAAVGRRRLPRPARRRQRARLAPVVGARGGEPASTEAADPRDEGTVAATGRRQAGAPLQFDSQY